MLLCKPQISQKYWLLIYKKGGRQEHKTQQTKTNKNSCYTRLLMLPLCFRN